MNTNSKKDIWVVGFPKSGNTWISYLSSYCFNLPFVNYASPRETPQKSWVKELTSGNNDWAKLPEFGSVQKTHLYPLHLPINDGLVLYAVRDPRDVFVSYHYFMRSNNAKLLGRIRYALLGFLGQQNQIKWFLRKWIDHLDIWKAHTHVFVSYDKLLADGSSYLTSIFSRTPLNVAPEIIMDAYERFSFKNMSGGRKSGSENQKSFFRKGISGDWANYFTESEAKIFDTAVKTYQEIIK